MNDPDDIDCTAWAEPHKALADLPRIRQDVQGLRVSAQDIVLNESALFAKIVAARKTTDPRLVPHLIRAIATSRNWGRAS